MSAEWKAGMAGEYRIRQADSRDAGVLAEYNQLLAMESEAKELDPAVVLAGVQALFAAPHRGTYFVAEIDGVVVGQLLITHEWSDWRNGDIWWLQSVYVREDHRRKGVFRMLCEHVRLSAEQDEGVVGLRLYVEEHNERAKASYERLGWSRSGYEVLEQMFRRVV